MLREVINDLMSTPHISSTYQHQPVKTFRYAKLRSHLRCTEGRLRTFEAMVRWCGGATLLHYFAVMQSLLIPGLPMSMRAFLVKRGTNLDAEWLQNAGCCTHGMLFLQEA